MNVEKIIRTSKKLSLRKKTIIHFMLVDHKMNDTISQALKPYDVSIQQFNVLRILRGLKGEPANLSTLNERMVTKMSNTTRLVDKLLMKGFVNRKVCPSNRRKIEITITDTGKKELEKMDTAMKNAEEKILENLSDKELEQLNVLFDKF